jgi:hypothetical protein
MLGIRVWSVQAVPGCWSPGPGCRWPMCTWSSWAAGPPFSPDNSTVRPAVLARASAERRIADAPRACQHWDRSRHQPREVIKNAIRHIRRLAGVLAGLAGVLLASAAAIPAAFAGTNPIPDPGGYAGDPYIGIMGTGPVTPVPATTVHLINTGGMPGWQITLIALGRPCSRPQWQCSWTGHEPPAGTRSPQPPKPCSPAASPAMAAWSTAT